MTVIEPIPETILTARRRQVLSAVVDKYVRTAHPVGSQTLVTEYRLPVSPATVRIEFGVLEDLGLIYQPHRSAGRLPSDRGYRAYVDQILPGQIGPFKPAPEWQQQLKALSCDIVQTVLEGCRILCHTTGYPAFAMFAEKERETVQAVYFNPLPGRRVVVSVYCSRCIQQPFAVDQDLPVAQWQEASHWWTAFLSGRSLSYLQEPMDDSLVDRESQRIPAVGLGYRLLRSLALTPEPRPVVTVGLSCVVSEPEFHEVEKIQGFFALWENPTWLTDLLPGVWAPRQQWESVWVSIGAENKLAQLKDCALVACRYWIGNNPAGVIGLAGPKRMRYQQALSAVASLAQLLSETLTFSFS